MTYQEILRKQEEHDRRFDQQDARLGVLEADMAEVKQDIKDLKADVGTLKSDVNTLKSDVSTLKVEVHRQGVLAEDRDQKVDQILDMVRLIAEQHVGYRAFESTLGDHGHRISALELAYKADR